MQQSAVDPRTGMIDMDIIATGIGAASNARIKEICDYIKKVHVSHHHHHHYFNTRTVKSEFNFFAIYRRTSVKEL